MSDSASTPELRVEPRGPVLWLTIQREERRNAMSHGVLAGMAQAIDAAQADRSLRAIVVTGAGNKAFCAGADLQAAQAFTTDYSEPYGHLALLLRRAKASNLPLVARVNGACMAGGMGLLAMCDLAVAASHAVFGLPEVKVGVFPAQVLSVLQHLVPRRATGRDVPDRRAAHGRAGAGIRPGELCRRRPGREAGLAAAAPAGQVAGGDPPRPVHDEEDRGHGASRSRCPSPRARSPCSR